MTPRETLEISTPMEIAAGTHFHAWHGSKTILVFLPADGEASWSLLPHLVSLLLGATVQPENTYSCNLKVVCQVWESQKKISINTNHSYHQRSSPWTSLNWFTNKIRFNQPIRKRMGARLVNVIKQLPDNVFLLWYYHEILYYVAIMPTKARGKTEPAGHQPSISMSWGSFHIPPRV